MAIAYWKIAIKNLVSVKGGKVFFISSDIIHYLNVQTLRHLKFHPDVSHQFSLFVVLLVTIPSLLHLCQRYVINYICLYSY